MPLPKDKKKFALWLHPQTLEEISGAYASDNCRSKSEFIEKAVKFYLAHLSESDRSLRDGMDVRKAECQNFLRH